MKDKLIKKIYDNGLYLIFGMQTFIFGLFLLLNQNIFSAKGAYSILADVLNEKSVSMVLIVIGLFNVFIVLMDKRKWKRVGLVSMQFVWLIFFFAFLIKQVHGSATTGWVLIFGLVVAMAYEAWKGEFD